jgi:hypothetical protein
MKSTFKILVLTLFFTNVNSQTIALEQFWSAGNHLLGANIFNVENKIYVVCKFTGNDEDTLQDSYKHRFQILSYDTKLNSFNVLFSSNKTFYDNYLNDIILLNNHFIVTTNCQTKKCENKIIVFDLNGNMVNEIQGNLNNRLLPISDSVFAVSNSDDIKNENLIYYNLKLEKQEINLKLNTKNRSIADPIYLADIEFIDRCSKKIGYEIGGCYQGNVLHLKTNSKKSYLLGCKFDSTFQNDYVNLFQLKNKSIKRLASYKLGKDDHNWVYDAIFLNGYIYAIFSSGNSDKKKQLNFKNVDQFLWLVCLKV